MRRCTTARFRSWILEMRAPSAEARDTLSVTVINGMVMIAMTARYTAASTSVTPRSETELFFEILTISVPSKLVSHGGIGLWTLHVLKRLSVVLPPCHTRQGNRCKERAKAWPGGSRGGRTGAERGLAPRHDPGDLRKSGLSTPASFVLV